MEGFTNPYVKIILACKVCNKEQKSKKPDKKKSAKKPKKSTLSFGDHEEEDAHSPVAFKVRSPKKWS